MTKKGVWIKEMARPREKRAAKEKFTWAEPVTGKVKRPSGQDFGAESEKGVVREGGKKPAFSVATAEVREGVRELRKEALKGKK